MLKLNTHVCFLIFVSSLFFLPSVVFAEKLTPLQKQAQAHRDRGLQYQFRGCLDEAMICYLKAITIDPEFVIAYNDLGIIYEAKGWQDRAEGVYLTALEIDPGYPNPYSNLAMLYEQRKDYKRAAEFLEKRIALGSVDGIWAQKAKERLRALLDKATPEIKQEYLREKAARLSQEIANKKRIKKARDSAAATRLFNEAKLLYQDGEDKKALNSINLALSLSPDNIETLLILKNEIEKKASIVEMDAYFQE